MLHEFVWGGVFKELRGLRGSVSGGNTESKAEIRSRSLNHKGNTDMLWVMAQLSMP